MANTLEVVKFRDVIPVHAMPRVFLEMDPPAVELKGRDFRTADQVYLNGYRVDDFIVMDQQTIIAQIPEGLRQFRTVSVLSSGFTLTSKPSKVDFEIGAKTRRIRGVLKLMQLFCKVLLQSPGSDIFNPTMGGGLQDLVGTVTSADASTRNMVLLSQAVSNTASQIKSTQVNSPGLPLSERLLRAELADIKFVRQLDEARARVRLVSMSGVVGVAAVEL